LGNVSIYLKWIYVTLLTCLVKCWVFALLNSPHWCGFKIVKVTLCSRKITRDALYFICSDAEIYLCYVAFMSHVLWLSFVHVFLWHPSAWWLSLMTFSAHNSLIPLLPECVEWITYLTQNSFVLLLYCTRVLYECEQICRLYCYRNCDGEVTGTLAIHSCYALGENMNFYTFLLIKASWWYCCGRIWAWLISGKENIRFQRLLVTF